MRRTLPVAATSPVPGVEPGAEPGARHRVTNIAHRGASGLAPENTLAALRAAITAGADLVEVDVQRTRDGALVLMHDTTLRRTTDARRLFPRRAPWRVADFTHAELSRLDAGSWKAARFSGERVPTLEDAMEVLGPSSTGLLVELKVPGAYPGIVRDLVATLRSGPGYTPHAAPAGRLVVQSFDYAAMKEHATQAPEIPVGLLGAPARENLPALATWAAYVNPSHFSVDRRYVDRVHELGMACHVWTVNRRPAMHRALRMGVDGVITNRPEVLASLTMSRAGAPLERTTESSA